MIINKKLFTNPETPHWKLPKVESWGSNLRESFLGPQRNKILSLIDEKYRSYGRENLDRIKIWFSKIYVEDFFPFTEEFWTGIFFDSIQIEQSRSYYSSTQKSNFNSYRSDREFPNALVSYIFTKNMYTEDALLPEDTKAMYAYAEYLQKSFQKTQIYSRNFWFLFAVNYYLEFTTTATLKEFLENETNYSKITELYQKQTLKNYNHTLKLIDIFKYGYLGSITNDLTGAAIDSLLNMSRKTWEKIISQRPINANSQSVIAKINEFESGEVLLSAKEVAELYEESITRAILNSGETESYKKVFPSMYTAVNWIQGFTQTITESFAYCQALKKVSEKINEDSSKFTPNNLAIFTFCIANPKTWVRGATQGNFWIVLEKAAEQGLLPSLIETMEDYALNPNPQVPTVNEWLKAIETELLGLSASLITTLAVKDGAPSQYNRSLVNELKRNLRLNV